MCAALFIAVHSAKNQQRRPLHRRSPAVAAQGSGLLGRDGVVNGLELKAGDSHINFEVYGRRRCYGFAAVLGWRAAVGLRQPQGRWAVDTRCGAHAIGAVGAAPVTIVLDWQMRKALADQYR